MVSQGRSNVLSVEVYISFVIPLWTNPKLFAGFQDVHWSIFCDSMILVTSIKFYLFRRPATAQARQSDKSHWNLIFHVRKGWDIRVIPFCVRKRHCIVSDTGLCPLVRGAGGPAEFENSLMKWESSFCCFSWNLNSGCFLGTKPWLGIFLPPMIYLSSIS